MTDRCDPIIDRDCKHGHLARSCEICELEVELDRLSRIEDKYNNLCPVLNEQAGEIQELKEELLRWKSKNGE